MVSVFLSVRPDGKFGQGNKVLFGVWDLEEGLQGVDVVVDGDSAVGWLGALAVEEGF